MFTRSQLTAIIFIVAFFVIGFIAKGFISFDPPLTFEKDSSVNSNTPLKSPLLSSKPVRKILVEIRGAIKRPGEYTLEEGNKYFELIKLAGGLTSKADQNRVKKNYTLKGGYTFYIPYKRSRKSFYTNKWIRIEIKGAVNKPGKYTLKQGSRYFDLIKLAGGLTNRADSRRVRKNYYLKDGYSFNVPFKRSQKGNLKNKWIDIEIRGAVKKPGVYKMRSGTRFYQLVKMAGGFGSKANRKKKYKNYYLKDGQSFYVPFK